MARYRNIVDLPVELIEAIYLRICPRCPDIPGIDASLAAILQPLVFESYKADADGCDSKRYVHRVVQLTRSLQARPDLAGRLRSLSFSFSLMPTLEDLGPAERQYVKETIARLGFFAGRFRPNWDDDPGYDYRKDLWQYTLLPFEVALIRAPAIEYLQLPVGDDWRLMLLLFLMARGARVRDAENIPTPDASGDPLATCSFPHLHTITFPIVVADDLPYHPTETDVPWTMLQVAPNVRSIRLPSDPGDLWPGRFTHAEVPPPLPHHRRVHLQHTCIGAPVDIYNFLEATPHLEAFALQWAPVLIQHKNRQDRDDVENALSQLWGMLERIKSFMEEGAVEGRIPGLESMRHFGRLERVSVNEDVLRWLRDVWCDWKAHWTWARDENYEWVPRDRFLVDMFPPTIRRVTFWRLRRYITIRGRPS
ncbi:uncharacterized protein C8A04DRAFT_30660 [Dichotomopilus funicola]|uniref:Uncharacterized protein n=1 Tax=Dichotomopilus funicola TaxID=1934379 RepID=A0AAN6ZLM4_9PEZI|nr:hypothetical protein C8A04DRAFT_30660 [Dichotomopilus funicola]